MQSWNDLLFGETAPRPGRSCGKTQPPRNARDVDKYLQANEARIRDRPVMVKANRFRAPASRAQYQRFTSANDFEEKSASVSCCPSLATQSTSIRRRARLSSTL